MTIQHAQTETGEEVPHAEVALKRGRIAEYDALRVVAIVAVVAIHVTAPVLVARGADKGQLLPAVNSFLRFAVPSFLFITGALVWNRPFDSGFIAYRSFMRRRFAVVVVPYLAWTALYLGLRYFWAGDVPHGRRALVAEVLHDLVTGGASAQLYFVPTVVMMYALAPLASRLLRKAPAAVMLVALAVATWLPPVVQAAFADGGTAEELLGLLVSYVPFAAAGACFELWRRRYPEPPALLWPALLVASLASVSLFGGADLGFLAPTVHITRRLLTVTAVWGLAHLLLRYRPSLASGIERWEEAVYGVFLIQPALLLLLGVLPVVSGWGPGWGGPVGMAAQLVVLTSLSFGAVMLLRSTRFTLWTVDGLRTIR